MAKKLLAYLIISLTLFSNVFGGVFLGNSYEEVHTLEELPFSEDYSVEVGAQNSFESSFSRDINSTISHTENDKQDNMYFLLGEKINFEQNIQILQPSDMLLHSLISGFSSSGSPLPLSDITSEKESPLIPEEKSRVIEVKKTTKQQKKLDTLRGNVEVTILPGTTIRTPEGSIIDTSLIQVDNLDIDKKLKAKSRYEKRMKNKGNLRKGFAEASVEGFEFGLTGSHLIFSQPVMITISTPHMSEGMAVDLMTMHAGDVDFHTDGLSVSSDTLCDAQGNASIPGSQAFVKNGKITFYTCGASSFTINPSGGGAASNDMRVIVGDCAQTQVYYNNLVQVYTGNPPANGCSVGGNMDSWPALRIGGTTIGNDFGAWTTSNTTGSTIGNTYYATSTMTSIIGGLTYSLIIDWEHTAPNKYLTWRWRVIVPPGNTNNVRFYYGMDSFVAGGDPNDVGYYTLTGGQTVGVYDNVANVLSGFRYLSGLAWTAHQADGYLSVRGQIANGLNFTNTVQTTGGDLGYGVNWDLGTTPGTYSGTLEWRLAPFVSGNVPDLIPGIGQPEGPLTVGFSSQIPIIISNVGNASSSGVHTAVLTLPANIVGPASPFVDNGWSCGATVGTNVTCTKTTTIAPLGDEIFRISVIPNGGAGGTRIFNLAISNPSDSNTTNNTAFASNSVIAATPTITPGGVTGAGFWSRADGGKNCTATGCTITTWFNSGTVAINAVTGIGIVTFDPITQINFNPTLYFNNASLNINNTLALPTLANSIFVVSRIGTGGNFYMGTQTNTTNGRFWRTSPTTDQWMRHNSTLYYNGANNRSPNVPAITSTVRQATGISSGFTNGRSVLTSNDNTAFVVNNLSLGGVAGTNSTLANIAEVIIYNSALTPANQSRVESYLALKYGITLDQTTARNYIFANGTTTSWNASLAGAYNRDIAGVARDDLTGLNQTRSQSINNPGDIIVNTVSSTIGSNARALIWGNNGAATGSFSTTDAPIGYVRIAREWQFQEKNGDVGSVKISYPIASLPVGAGNPVYMLVDGDGAFATGSTVYTGTLIGGNWEWTLNMTDMSVITFAQGGDIVPPTISSVSIGSGTLIPHGNFSLSYNFTDTGAGISPSTATGRIFSWNSGSLTYDTTPLSGYMTVSSSNTGSATMSISNLPHGRYRFDLLISDLAGNTSTRSVTYFVDALEWTVSTPSYSIGNIPIGADIFGTGELVVTVRTVGAGFNLRMMRISDLSYLSNTIPVISGGEGWGYDLNTGSGYTNLISPHASPQTIASVSKNINQNGQRNTFTYRIKYGANTSPNILSGDYQGIISMMIDLTY